MIRKPELLMSRDFLSFVFHVLAVCLLLQQECFSAISFPITEEICSILSTNAQDEFINDKLLTIQALIACAEKEVFLSKFYALQLRCFTSNLFQGGGLLNLNYATFFPNDPGPSALMRICQASAQPSTVSSGFIDPQYIDNVRNDPKLRNISVLNDAGQIIADDLEHFFGGTKDLYGKPISEETCGSSFWTGYNINGSTQYACSSGSSSLQLCLQFSFVTLIILSILTAKYCRCSWGYRIENCIIN